MHREHAAPLSVRICHLYPKLLSVAGDRGNLYALTRRCAWRGIGTAVTEADVGQHPDLTAFDLILLHGGQDCEMRAAAADLAGKAASLRDAVEAGTAVLAVCAGYQLLGRYYAPVGAPPITGIGILDAVTEGGTARFMSHIAVDCDLGHGKHRLAGFENHSGRTYLGPGTAPLGHVIAGAGNNGQDGTEGARYRHVHATYLHGPVLPKNPWFTDHLISTALQHRYRDAAPGLLAPLEDHAETAAHAAALKLARRTTRPWRTTAPARPAPRHAGTPQATTPQPRQAQAGPRQTDPAGQAAGSAQPADQETAWTSR